MERRAALSLATQGATKNSVNIADDGIQNNIRIGFHDLLNDVTNLCSRNMDVFLAYDRAPQRFNFIAENGVGRA